MKIKDERAILDTLSSTLSQETEQQQYDDTYVDVERNHYRKTTTIQQCSSSHQEERYAFYDYK